MATEINDIQIFFFVQTIFYILILFTSFIVNYNLKLIRLFNFPFSHFFELCTYTNVHTYEPLVRLFKI